MDELKKYLQNHHGELNLDEPRPQVWQNIRKEVQGAKKTNVVMLVARWGAAACVLALAGIGAWYMATDKKTADPQVTVVAKKETPVATKTAVVPDTLTANSIPEKPLITVQVNTVSKNKNTATSKPAAQPATELHMLNEIESSFTQVINLQRARVSTMPMYAETPAYFEDFKTQIKSMEKDEKSIKSEITRRGMNDVLLDQLINLYQQKLNVLKQLQIEMNKTNNRYKQSRSPVDPAKTYFLNI